MTIRKWSEVLQHWTMWHGCVDKELCWWCGRSSGDIPMICRNMSNDSRVAH